jgi:hypothetical protein
MSRDNSWLNGQNIKIIFRRFVEFKSACARDSNGHVAEGDMSLEETKAMNGPTRFRLNDEEGCALKNLV